MPANIKALEVHLMPGEYFVGDASHRPRTLLGSCVSITLWHRQARMGAMSHFLLATRNADFDQVGLDGRYGDEALLLMLRELVRADVNPDECEAKIFGGASMLYAGGEDAFNVGRRNGAAARALLGKLGIRVASESLFGTGHRNIIFDISTGAVWARQVNPAEQIAPRKAA